MVEDFINRLQKNVKHISKWARRQGITCYRLYDLDMTEYPFCIDRYEHFIYVAEYHANHGMDDDQHTDWLQACIRAITLVCEVLEDDVYLKIRQKQRGLQQYQKFDRMQHTTWVNEAALKFKINLTDYLDAGLFLDHRNTRQMVRTQSAGKDVLNLFCYTGSFSVYAAAGGAQSVTSVDLSNTYLQWAKENMNENGFNDSLKYSFVQADILQWLRENHHKRFDIIVMDPPTFSNSKRMKDILDIQRDHLFMVDRCLRLLNEGGVLYFSTNFRDFQPELDRVKATSVKEISKQTVPQDFRNKNIHRCFIIEK